MFYQREITCANYQYRHWFNVKVLCAVGDFGEGIFNLPHKPDRSTNVQLTTSAPIAQNTCYGLPFHDTTLWAEYN